MNIEYLREFIEIGLTLNLSKAARTLHISQPSLSKHISALEQECQTPLLSRSASRIQLTAAGQALFEEAFSLVHRHDEMVERVRSYRNVKSLRIGGLYDSGTSIKLINRALAIANKNKNIVSIAYQNYRYQSLKELMHEDKIDIVISMMADCDVLPEGDEKLLLFKAPMVCLVDQNNPLAQKDVLSIHDLEGVVIHQPVGSRSAEYGRTTVREIFQRYRVQPIQQPVFVRSISELTTVPTEDGAFIMEETMLDTQPNTRNLKILRFVEEDVAFPFYAIWRKDRSDASLDAFLEGLRIAVEEEQAAKA